MSITNGEIDATRATLRARVEYTLQHDDEVGTVVDWNALDALVEFERAEALWRDCLCVHDSGCMYETALRAIIDKVKE